MLGDTEGERMHTCRDIDMSERRDRRRGRCGKLVVARWRRLDDDDVGRDRRRLAGGRGRWYLCCRAFSFVGGMEISLRLEMVLISLIFGLARCVA